MIILKLVGYILLKAVRKFLTFFASLPKKLSSNILPLPKSNGLKIPYKIIQIVS